MGKESCPSDSESDYEFYEDDSDIPSLEELLEPTTKEDSFTGLKMRPDERYRLFRGCKIESKLGADSSKHSGVYGLTTFRS